MMRERRGDKPKAGDAAAPADASTTPSAQKSTDAVRVRGGKESRQLSTSFSDLVLAVSCFYVTYELVEMQGRKRFLNPNSHEYAEGLLQHLLVKGEARLYASIAFLLIGIAASFGVLRFARVASAIAPHEFFTNLALFLSTPLLGLCAYTYLPLTTFNLSKHDFLFFGFLFLLFNFFVFYGLMSSSKQLYTLVTGALAMLAIIYLGILYIVKNPAYTIDGKYLIAGSVLYILSGTVIGSTGHYFGLIPRVDIFHYALAIANLLIARAYNEIFD